MAQSSRWINCLESVTHCAEPAMATVPESQGTKMAFLTVSMNEHRLSCARILCESTDWHFIQITSLSLTFFHKLLIPPSSSLFLWCLTRISPSSLIPLYSPLVALGSNPVHSFVFHCAVCSPKQYVWCQVGTGNSRRTLCEVYDCLASMLYTRNQYKIILKINCNWKIKSKE